MIGRALIRMFGVRIVESPEAMRATFPRYLVALGIFDRVAEKLRTRNKDLVSVRTVGRSIIVRYR